MSRRSREELRDLMIDAGCELVRQRGLAFDPPSLTYATVFDHIEQTRGVRLHRSQVHDRIWANQEAYRIDVAVSTIRDSLAGSDHVDQLVEYLDRPDNPTAARRLAEQWVTESIEISIKHADANRRVDLFVAAEALSASGSRTAPEIAEATQLNLERRMEHNTQRIRDLASQLDIRPDPNLGLDDDAFAFLARAGSSLIEGGRLLETVDGELNQPFETLDADGAPVTRTATALAFSLLVEEVFGLQPNESEAAENR
jgi:hypothetical protein